MSTLEGLMIFFLAAHTAAGFALLHRIEKLEQWREASQRKRRRRRKPQGTDEPRGLGDMGLS
jgi:hypothetical protein